ncbi:MAG: ABC transporter permease DevC [Cyanobacteria bacterium MAG STY4_bin_9]|jgi:putative ABC transport system permease protein|uniref:ABC transporter permease DevC n=1 Tax=unclassified Synechococcus TaxID=2626047 RepID=UPI00014A7CB0|nr:MULTISPECIES: ABC transporter permease DevC [unclassified Synechococcus]MBN89984.1 ABC transporter [Synechococcus sp. RS344]MCH1604395.1 ABC transporter permease DevC [Synechococcus sp. MOX_bin13]MCY3847756.1 ABC transporter permease DevC [Cyanobacteria bacterium MAG COS4_bin_21]MCY4085000.1 ABC transporter permease DevC [Cyanobacteria bacterium MAG COS1_bin_9]MDD9861895.1 ABC transporter permease DevC [Cyanobacteria bacterium MAG STY2_bin_7]MDD9882676.1 ABC transporter permease DevC [Cyan|tara:strand:+ start:291 stop:1460 length:1170 start_codon:yes stop_codon:yes gene_type:complete
MNRFWRGRRIPLSWLLLTRQPVRLLVALAGISFAGILMFMQLGFRDGLFDASVTAHRLFDADVVLISPRSASSVSMEAFPRRRLVQTLADPDVDGVTPVHWGLMLWRNPETRRNRSILALGFNPDDPFFVDPSLAEKTDALKQKGRILFDQLSRPEFGPIADWYRDGRVVETEIAGNRVRVAGLVSLGTSFGADGNLLTSTETFLDLMPQKPPGAIEVGLVRLKPGADPEQVVSRLRQRLPKDVSVLTKQGFIDFEQNYWKSSTSIGFIFTLGAAMGFVVGCVIVYQVLYTDVSDHLPEYATLMAMGYRLSHLLGVVVREGFYLAAMGYVPAYMAGQGLYWFVRDATKLPVGMDLSRALTVLVMILVMCMLSSFLAMRRLIDADPAEIF